MEIKSILEELQTSLTVNRLQELTLNILEAKKEGNQQRLQFLHHSLFGGDYPEDTSGSHLFFKLIHFFHPDRLALIKREIHDAAEVMDLEKLRFYRRVFSAPEWIAPPRRMEPVHHSWQHEESYGYGTADGDEQTYDSEYYDDDDAPASDFDDTFRTGDSEEYEEFFRESEEEMDFIRAVKAEYVGVLDMAFTPSDLAALTDELELVDYGIEDLEGLDYCRGLINLNLSDNRISKLYDLRNLYHLKELYLSHNQIHDLSVLEGLTNLEILDLAFNDIDDVTPLLALTKLKFLNLLGNPLKEKEVLKELKSRGVFILG